MVKNLSLLAIIAIAGICMVVQAGEANNGAKSCLGVAMSGGGSRGAYEAGILWGLQKNLKDKSQMAWDVVTGVSAGSINTMSIALFKKGDEANLVEFLSKAWQNLTTDDAWKSWKGGILDGILNHSGAVDDSPLIDYLTQLGLPLLPMKRKYEVTAVDVNSGSIIKFTEKTSSDYHKMVREAVSSSSMPIIFPTQTWPEYNVTLIDGGTAYNVNIVGAIERCREQVDDDSQITIDVFDCDPFELDEYKDDHNSIQNFLRRRAINKYANKFGDIWKFIHGFPKVNFRYVVYPSELVYGGLDLINFDNSTHTWKAQMLGRQDAEDTLSLGEGWFAKHARTYGDTPSLQKEFPSFGKYISHARLRDLEAIKQQKAGSKVSNPQEAEVSQSETTSDQIYPIQK